MIAPLAYLDTGFPRGTVECPKTLIFVHGDFSAGVFTWGRQVQELKDRYRLVCVDRKGHGRTPAGEERYTFRGDALDLIATAKSLGIKKAHLVGHSYGALVALEATRIEPQLASSIHLVEAPYLSLLPGDPDVRRLATQSRAGAQLGDAASPDEIAFLFFKAVIGAEAAERLREHRAWPSIVRDAGRLTQEEFAADYPASAIRDIPDVPVFIYSGGRSHPALRKLSEQLSTTFRAPHETFDEAGHDVPKSASGFTESLARNVDSTV